MVQNISDKFMVVSFAETPSVYMELLFMPLTITCISVLYYVHLRYTFSKFPSVSFEFLIVYIRTTGFYIKELPIATVALTLLISFCKHFEKQGFFVLWILKPYIFVFDEKYIKILSNDQTTIDRPVFYDILSDAIGKSLLTISGHEWMKSRKMMNPAFSFKELRYTMAGLNGGAERIVKSITEQSNNSSMNVLPVLKLGVLKIFCETILGLNMNNKMHEDEFNEYIKATSRLAESTIDRFSQPWLWSKHFLFLFKEGREMEKLHKKLQNFAEMIAKRMMESSSGDTFNHSGMATEKKLLRRIFIEKLTSDPSFTIRDVEHAVNNLLFAGHDTSSYAILYCLFMLGHHPEVQDQAFSEVDAVTSHSDGSISYSDLNNLKYLECIIKETLRIYTVVPMFGRVTGQDTTCGKYKIPKGTMVGFVPYMAHRNPDVFPNPEKFDPERFNGKCQKNPWTYIPFAEGTRSCIGKNFALMEIKVILAHILKNFEIISLDKREDVFFNWKIIMTPLTPIRLQFIKRR